MALGPEFITPPPVYKIGFEDFLNNSTAASIFLSCPLKTDLLRELVALTGFPITSTLQGLGAYPGNDPQFLGMLGMHGTYEANNAMHD